MFLSLEHHLTRIELSLIQVRLWTLILFYTDKKFRKSRLNPLKQGVCKLFTKFYVSGIKFCEFKVKLSLVKKLYFYQ